MELKHLEISSIRTDGGTQSREALHEETYLEYAEAMLAGDMFPPVVVFHDGSSYWLADGFHRFFGAQQAGADTVGADVRQGTQADAQLFSYGVNKDHGLRRTNADKRRSVSGALKHPVSCKWSDNQIAKHCGVDHKTVASVRNSHLGISQVTTPTERTYTTKHGTEAVMQTKNIGKAAPTVAPVVTAPSLPAAPEPPTPAPAPVSAAPDYDGPSEEELRAHALQEQADRDALDKLMESDDKLAAAYAEIKRLNAVNAVLEVRFQGVMNQCAEQVRMIKSLQRKLDKVAA